MLSAAVLCGNLQIGHAAEPALAVPPCAVADGFEPICGFARPPEDLEVLPGAQALLVSEYGALSGARPGQLSVLDLATRERRLLFAGGTEPAAAAASGEQQCPGAPGPEFSPHGIHLAVVGGRQRLLVVNHGAREAIEIFELAGGPAAAEVQISWRGCVPAPAEVWFNDVANLPDGGLVATHMITRGTPEEGLLAAEASRTNTGYVLEWHADGGWHKVIGSDGGLPNGIAVSPDGSMLYIDQYFGDRVIALDRLSGARRWEAEVAAPDNVSIAPSGELLVASHRVGLETIIGCAKHSEIPCGAPYAIVALDPTTGAQKSLFTGEGAPMGGATVAVQVNDVYYLGSFVGERILKRAATSVSPP
jgi:hypothetical protein